MKNNITQRSVLYVGYKCNIHCQFCYYRFTKNKEWRKLNDVKKEALRFRYFYKNIFVDITGGEPTIYPHIFELVRYCHSIGLKPTIITNALVLVDYNKCLEFKKSGINNFLISIYGLGKNAAEITGINNIETKQKTALDNLIRLKIPFNFNVTIHKLTLSLLPQIAQLAGQKGAQIMNMIVFCPFLEWQNKTNVEFQEKYSVLAPYLVQAINLLEENDLEANVRYLPFCQLRGYEKNIYNFPQLSYDPGEWDFNSWGNYFLFNPNEKWYVKEAARKRIYDAGYIKSDKCKQCSLNYICDGFPIQYVKRFGWGEEKPYDLGKKIRDPKYFIKQQNKKYTLVGHLPDKKLWPYMFEDKQLVSDIIKNRLKYWRLKITQNRVYSKFRKNNG